MALPIPTCVTLYNRFSPVDDAVFVTEEEEQQDSLVVHAPKSKVFRPDYSMNLLVPVRLEIFHRVVETENEENQEEEEKKETEQTVYSVPIHQSSVCSIWDHLNERVDDWQSNWEAHAESTRLRLVLLKNKTATKTKNHNDQTSKNDDKDKNEDINKGKINVLVDSLPLHPHLLKRLFKHDDESIMTHPTNKGHLQQPPSMLPPNAVLIHYSDGWVRVQNSLYHTLVQQGVIEESNDDLLTSTALANDDNGSGRNSYHDNDDDDEARKRSMFEDNMFNALDNDPNNKNAITSTNNNNNNNKNTSDSPKQTTTTTTTTSLLETDNEFLATPIRTVPEYEFDDLATSVPPHSPSLMGKTEQDVLEEDYQHERQRLLAQIVQEEEWLRQELEELNQESQYLQDTMQDVQTIQEETTLIRMETAKVLSEQPIVSFTMTLYQRKLVKELQQIYPITFKINPDQHQRNIRRYRYWIAGAELSDDLFRGQVHEDELSAALGFVAHTLVMMSKYMAVPLRHRIICNSSRSAIQDCTSNNNNNSSNINKNNNNGGGGPGNAGKILPLFLSRVAERPQLERGMMLLHHNVSCLAQSQNIVFYNSPSTIPGEGGNVSTASSSLSTTIVDSQEEDHHLLAKIQQVYDHVIHGI